MNWATYGSTCGGYCSGIGLTCVDGWEETSETCNVKYHIGCDGSVSYESSDAICECAGLEPTNLRPGCFAGLGNLHDLKLGANYIEKFENGTFEGLDSLETLDLRGMYSELGCLDAYNAGLSTTVACFDKYNYDRTAPFFAPGLQMDYAQAVSYCTGMGGEIAVINDADENELARQACGQSKCWVGLEEVGGNVSTPRESQIWRWRDGSEATYVNWRDGHPRNYRFTYCDLPHGGDRWCDEYIGDKRNAVMFCGGVEDNECNGEWKVYKIDKYLSFERYIPEELEYRDDLPNSDTPRPLCRMY